MESSRNADTGNTLWESWDGWFKDLVMRRIRCDRVLYTPLFSI